MDPKLPQAPISESLPQDPTPPQNPNSIGIPLKRKNPLKIILIALAGTILLIATALFLGLRSSEPKEATPQDLPPTVMTQPSPTRIVTPAAAKLQAMKFLPGKGYYNDSISMITRDNPHQILTVSATRAEQESNYLQYTTVNFFDGTNWSSNIISNFTANSNIFNNIIIRNWSTPNSQSDSSKKDLSFTFSLKNSPITLQSSTLQSEINLVSLPDYTKFVYQGQGKAVISNISHDAYFTYSRSYSLNAANLEFFNNPASLTSKWLSLWDEKGNFYIVDSLSSTKRNGQNQFYSTATTQDTSGAIKRITSPDVTQSGEDTGHFTARLNSQSFDFRYLTSNDKAGPNDTFTWTVGPVDGSTVSGTGDEKKSSFVLGLYEKIHPKK